MHRKKILLIIAALAAAALLLAACAAPAEAPAAEGGPAAVPTCPAAPEAAPCPTAEPPVVDVVPFEELWAASPHNAADTEAFIHWNEEDPQEIPANCATCHSGTGYMDFLGADGSAAGAVDNPVPVGTTIECQACHNPAAAALTSVTFPSGVTVNDLGGEARCMVCHQGRASKVTIDGNIEKFGVTDVDAVVEPITEGDRTTNFGFVNIHYFAAAATLYAGEVQGGYQYDGKSYDAKNDHITGYDTCIDCHNPHSTEVKVEQCAFCHEGVTSVEDLRNVRMISSAPDYDGDGNDTEGMADEIATLQEVLYGSIQAYAKEVAGAGIVYDVASHPYFFLDADGDGAPDQNEDGGNVAYNAWTARLLKAAYNYQVSLKDPGAYAHGNKYIVQLLYDSIEDLNTKLGTPVDMTAMHRDDAGHFAGNTEAFRHWDAEEYTVPGSCAKCHSSTGMAQFIKEGAVISNKASNGFVCYTCHNDEAWPEVYGVTSVPFPSGASITFSVADADGKLAPVAANLCLECHQGRESTVSMNRALASFTALDTPDAGVRFRNVHYFAAGATLFGDAAKGIYQYDGKTYAGQFMHQAGKLNTCTDCHDAHVLNVKTETCAGCHGTDDVEAIRLTSVDDYDGDGDATEGLYGELETYKERLYAAIQAYATTKAGTGILYNAAAYPYWFTDADGDGVADVNAEGGNLSYSTFTPRLVKAAYNYQYAMKDPGAFAHNFKYVAQALYDSIQDLGGDLTGLVRPQ